MVVHGWDLNVKENRNAEMQVWSLFQFVILRKRENLYNW